MIIGAVVLIGITAPFWHMWANKNSTEEFIGFRNLRIFLYSFGSHFAAFCFAFFVFWIKNFIDAKYAKIKKIINVLGGVFIAISVYFLLWVVIPVNDFPEYVYRIAFLSSAAVVSYGVYLLNRFMAHIALHTKFTIKNLLAFIVRVRTDHYKTVAKKALYAELHNKAMETEDTVKDNASAFEEDLYNTLEKVAEHHAK